jgi:uncharacterized protein
MKQTPPINILPSGMEVPGRTCSGCTLCCSLLGIVELKKPVFTICKHCVIGKGCKIYEVRPQTCAGFYCSYRISADLPEYWNPKICGMVLHRDANGGTDIISVICSNSAKHRWKQEPYWNDIKQIAADVHIRQGAYVRILRKGQPVLIINPKTFETHAVGNLKGMAALPQWQQPNQTAEAVGRGEEHDLGVLS